MDRLGDFLIALLKWLLIFGVIGWVVYLRARRTEDERFISKLIITAALIPLIIACITTGFLGAMFAPFFAVILAFMWGPNLGRLIASPITNALDGGNEPPEAQPFYSITHARRKQGRYDEALAEVRKQLALFPQDLEGWLLLAQIQVEDFHDLTAAERTVQTVLHQQTLSPAQIAHALSTLADWQIKCGQNIDAARTSFERIVELLPDTEFALLAAQRIAHLAHPDRPMQKEEPRTIHLPRHEENIGLRDDFTGLKPPETDYAAEADQLVKHLQEHPLDFEARERLALIYAHHYLRLDLAVDQLEQLITQAHDLPKQGAHWLNLQADLHIRHGNQVEAARQCLQRIIDLFPNSAQSELARQRMAYLKLEARGQQRSQVIKLGSYEDNIGLKRDWPT
jgi:tetratricopeptide (TPR) repeat protein